MKLSIESMHTFLFNNGIYLNYTGIISITAALLTLCSAAYVYFYSERSQARLHLSLAFLFSTPLYASQAIHSASYTSHTTLPGDVALLLLLWPLIHLMQWLFFYNHYSVWKIERITLALQYFFFIILSTHLAQLHNKIPIRFNAYLEQWQWQIPSYLHTYLSFTLIAYATLTFVLLIINFFNSNTPKDINYFLIALLLGSIILYAWGLSQIDYQLPFQKSACLLLPVGGIISCFALTNLHRKNNHYYSSMGLRLSNAMFTFTLVLLLGYGYMQNQKQQESYQKEHRALAQRAWELRSLWQSKVETELISPDLRYLISYNEKNQHSPSPLTPEITWKRYALDPDTIIQDLWQTKIYKKITQNKVESLREDLLDYIDRQKQPYFAGYKALLLDYLDTSLLKNVALARSLPLKLEWFSHIAKQHHTSLQKIDNKSFPIEIKAFLAKKDPPYSYFATAISDYIEQSNQTPEQMKQKVLLFLRPLQENKAGYLRKSSIETQDKYQHFMAFTHYDNGQSISEVGFSYSAYRRETHKAMSILFLLILFSFVCIILFLLRAKSWLRSPLIELEDALQTVSQGILQVKLLPQNNNEIGSLAHTFQNMLRYLRDAQTRVQSYAISLENKKDIPPSNQTPPPSQTKLPKQAPELKQTQAVSSISGVDKPKQAPELKQTQAVSSISGVDKPKQAPELKQTQAPKQIENINTPRPLAKSYQNNDLEKLIQEGTQKAKEGNHTAALPLLEKAYQLDTQHSNLKLSKLVTLLYFKNGEYNATVKTAKECLKLDNQLIDIWFCLALSYKQLNILTASLEASEQLHKLAPQNIANLINMIEINIRLHKFTESKALITEILKLEPNNKLAKELESELNKRDVHAGVVA